MSFPCCIPIFPFAFQGFHQTLKVNFSRNRTRFEQANGKTRTVLCEPKWWGLWLPEVKVGDFSRGKGIMEKQYDHRRIALLITFDNRGWVKDQLVNPAVSRCIKQCLVGVLGTLKVRKVARVWQWKIVES